MFKLREKCRAGVLAACGFATIVAGSQGQDGARVEELPVAQLDAEKLVQILAPAEPPPPIMRGRSLTPIEACAFYKKRLTRGLTVEAVAGSQVAALAVPFAFNSAEISAEAGKILDVAAEALASPTLSPCCFKLEGHTDAIGSEEQNLRLSDMRANAVIRYLATRHGIDASRMLAVGLGESAAIADNSTEEGRARNRRVQFVNLGYPQPSEN